MDITSLTPVGIAGAGYVDLVSDHSGAVYRILIYVPRTAAPASGWPVLYLTDGNAGFATAVDSLKIHSSHQAGTNVGGGVVVAIGYPTDEPYDAFRRAWDLSPPPGRAFPPYYPNTPEVMTGGAGEFLSFIETQVKPLIAALVPVDVRRQALYGHSFGGLFALYALFTRPQAFRTWIAVSPTIYWEDCEILGFERRFLAQNPQALDMTLHLSAGQYEGDELAPFQKQRPDAAERTEKSKANRTIAYAQEMAVRLGAIEGLGITTSFQEFAGETHMSLVPVAVNRAVQIAFELPAT